MHSRNSISLQQAARRRRQDDDRKDGRGRAYIRNRNQAGLHPGPFGPQVSTTVPNSQSLVSPGTIGRAPNTVRVSLLSVVFQVRSTLLNNLATPLQSTAVATITYNKAPARIVIDNRRVTAISRFLPIPTLIFLLPEASVSFQSTQSH